MTKQIPEIRLVHSRSEDILNGLIGVASVALMYYATNPSRWDRHVEMVKDKWNTFTHRLSVLQTLEAIHSLPETDHQ